MLKQLNKQGLTGVQSGLTLIEILVVLAIVAMLAGLVGPTVLNQLGGAKSKTARVQIKELEQALEMYKLDVGRYPSAAEGLDALVSRSGNADGWNGPYLKSGVPLDPWKNEYRYSIPGARAEIDIYSLGQDGAEGGQGEDADVGNW
ncbi:MAG: type II secretion system major pseudopilin GspG [Halioglobus sp.]|nr:type II secretion system major pseudopilin GspG [Halioglobus sp.]